MPQNAGSAAIANINMSLPVSPEHQEALAKVLADTLKISPRDATKIVKALIQPTTLYRHINGQRADSKLRDAIKEASVAIPDKNLIDDAVEILALLTPATPCCAVCHKPTIGLSGISWVTRNIGEQCPYCRHTIQWEQPKLTFWSWILRHDRSMVETEGRNGSDDHPDRLKLVIHNLGGLHPDIVHVLELKDYVYDEHAEPQPIPEILPKFLAALWDQNPMRYANEHFRVVWSLTARHYGAMLYTQRNLTEAKLVARGDVKVAKTPAPPTSDRWGGAPTETGQVDVAELRDEIGRVLRTDSEFVAFCDDYFSDTSGMFSDSMDRLQKVNLLLRREDKPEISQRLDEVKKRSRRR